MTGIILPRRFRTQPQAPALIDYQGLGKGLKILFNPAVGPVDLVTGRRWSAAGTVAPTLVSRGKVFKYDGVDSYYSYTGYPELTNNVGTYFTFCPVVGVTDTFGHVFLGSASPGAVAFQVSQNGEVQVFGSGFGSASLSGWFNSTNRSLSFSSGGSGSTCRLFVDGKNSGITWTGAPVSWGSGNKTINLGRYPGGQNWDFNGTMLITGFTTAVWGEAEARAFHQNPFLIFKPSKRRLYGIESSTIAPSSLEPSAAEVTSVASTPILTPGSLELAPTVASSTSVAATPTLTPGNVNLAPTVAESQSVGSVPTLSPSGVTLTPTVAESSSVASIPTLATAASDLQPVAAVSTTVASTPTLSSGPAALTPAVAVVSTGAATPTLQNGATLAVTPGISTSVASVPVLSAGSVNLEPDVATSSSEAVTPTLTAGSVTLTPSVAQLTTVGVTPILSSGSVLNITPAGSVSVAVTPVLVAGNTALAPTAASSTSVAAVPVFQTAVTLLVEAASVTSVAADAILFNTGAGRSAIRLYAVDTENRSYAVPSTSRNYSIPV